jgi:hypothetical protein
MNFDLNWKGRLYQVVGTAVLILAMFFAKALEKSGSRDALVSFLSFDSSSWSGTVLTVVLFLVVAPMIGYAAVAMLRRGHRLRANVLASQRTTPSGLDFDLRDQQGRVIGLIDAKSSVLYLRSFAEDSVTAESRPRGLNQFMSELATEEEQLAAAVEPVGPLVAIGRPGEALPELGALRLYVSDDEWQDVVIRWLTNARLVILRVAGNTEGLWWEISQAPRFVAPERLVLLLPMKGVAYKAFRKRVERLFPQGLPDYDQEWPDLLRRKGLMGLIYFERDWTPRFEGIDPPFLSWEKRNAAKAVLETALWPVFAQLGVSLTGSQSSSLNLSRP